MPEHDTLVWHMLDWELHSLRGVVTALLIEIQLYARAHPHDREAMMLKQRAVDIKRSQYERQLAEMREALVHDVYGEAQTPVVPTAND